MVKSGPRLQGWTDGLAFCVISMGAPLSYFCTDDLGSPRAAFFHASTYWGLALFVITEGLSLPHWLTSRGVTVPWMAFCAGCLAVPKRKNEWKEDFRLRLRRVAYTERMALVGIGCLLNLPPLCLAVWLSYPGKLRWKFVKHAFAAAALALLISAPHMMRCYSLSGSPFGFPLPDGGARMMVRVKHVGLGVTAANIVRNVSLNINPPGDKLTELAQKATRKVISLMGQDPDDQSAIWIGSTFQLNHFSPNEIHAGNPLHLLLLLLACGWAIRRGWHGEKRSPFLFAFGLISASVLFSALMRWQEWNSRYFVTLFVLGAGLIGLFMETRRSRKVSIGVVFVLLTSTSLYALFNRYRSLIPASQVVDIYHSRAELYFSDQHRAFAADTIAMADEINRSGCRELAVDSYFPEVDWTSGVTPRSLWVYPLFALIHADGSHTRLRYISVHNLSARFAVDSSRIRPCAVMCLSCAKIPEKWEQYNQPDTRTSAHGENVLFQYFPR